MGEFNSLKSVSTEDWSIICNQRTRGVIPQLTLASKRESTRLGEGQHISSPTLPSPTLQFAIPPSPNSSLMSPVLRQKKKTQVCFSKPWRRDNKAEHFAARESLSRNWQPSSGHAQVPIWPGR